MRNSLRLLFGIAAVGAVVASFFVDVHAGFGFVLRPPAPELYRYWLPFVIFLLLVLCWLTSRLWNLVDARPATFEFRDIDAAWNEAMQFLDEFEIDFRATPVFVVLGEGDGSFFAAQGLQVTKIPLSQNVDFAFHLQSSGEAIYITCPGASAVTLESLHQRSSSAQRAQELAAMHKILARAQKEGRGLDRLTEEEKESISNAIEEEHGSGETTSDSRASKRRLRKALGRLRRLCQLIALERQPYCPLNGVLVLMPFAAATTEQRATYAASCIQQDLLVARRALQVDCPVYFAVCDLHQITGGAEFLASTPEIVRQQALGLRFPLLPDLDPHETAAMLERGVQWVCRTLIARHLYKLLRPTAPQLTAPETWQRNVNLFRLTAEFQRNAGRLAHIVSRATELSDGAAVMVGGIYVAASGNEELQEHAFVAGVLRELHMHQNYVSWTPETLGRNRRAMRTAGVGFATFFMCVASLGYFFWRS